MTIPPLLRVGAYQVRAWIGTYTDDFVDRELMTIHVGPRADDPQEFLARTRAVQPEIEWKVEREPAP